MNIKIEANEDFINALFTPDQLQKVLINPVDRFMNDTMQHDGIKVTVRQYLDGKTINSGWHDIFARMYMEKMRWWTQESKEVEDYIFNILLNK